MAARRRTSRPVRPAPPPRPVPLDELPKISASLIEFAGPILDTLPYPPTIEQMRQAMMIAQTAWNLPIVEDEPGGEGAELRALYERQMTLAPPFFRAMMDALLHARRTRWARDPRLVAKVEVIREPEEFRIVATASILGAKNSW